MGIIKTIARIIESHVYPKSHLKNNSHSDKQKRQSSFRVIVDDKGETRTLIGEYEIMTNRILGHGGNSVVHLGRNLTTNSHVAIKSIPISPARLKRIKTGEQLDEVRTMRRLLSPLVCKLHDVFVTDSFVYLVMDLVEGKELFELVKDAGSIPEPRARKIFSQMVTAVQYLHSVGTIHNDLKLENVILGSQDDHVTIIDFGHASSPDISGFKPGIPTLEYVAPEMLTCGEFSQKSDVWSLGVLLYIMVVGYFPFSGTEEEVRGMIVETKPTFPKDQVSQECRDLIKRMLEKDPSQRITLEQVKSHPWFLQGLEHYDFSTQTIQ